MERRSYRITGRVQGVGFRWWTRKTAQELSLRGTVENLADGSVQVVAEGEPADLDRLEERLRSGPPPASVSSLEREEPDRESLPTGFEIVR